MALLLDAIFIVTHDFVTFSSLRLDDSADTKWLTHNIPVYSTNSALSPVEAAH